MWRNSGGYPDPPRTLVGQTIMSFILPPAPLPSFLAHYIKPHSIMLHTSLPHTSAVNSSHVCFVVEFLLRTSAKFELPLHLFDGGKVVFSSLILLLNIHCVWTKHWWKSYWFFFYYYWGNNCCCSSRLNMKGCLALVLCAAGLTAWTMTAGKNNTFHFLITILIFFCLNTHLLCIYLVMFGMN